MNKGPDPIAILVLVFVVGFVITGVSKSDFTAERPNAPVAELRS